MTIRAIETRYAGCRFRSRLEARWAVFFDTMGIRWEYEPKGFVTKAGPYLPDFRLPDLRLFVEVKGSDPGQRDLDRCGEIALACQRHGGDLIILVGDIPRNPPVTCLRFVPENPFDDDSELVWESQMFRELRHATWNDIGRALDSARSARFELTEATDPRTAEAIPAAFPWGPSDCRLCFGRYPAEELLFRERDGSCDLGPVCLYCYQSLTEEARRASSGT